MFSLLNPDTKKYILTICIFVIIHDNWHFSLGIGGLSTCTVQLTRVHQGFFQGIDSKFLRNILSKSLASIFSVAKATLHSQMSVHSSVHLSSTCLKEKWHTMLRGNVKKKTVYLKTLSI